MARLPAYYVLGESDKTRPQTTLGHGRRPARDSRGSLRLSSVSPGHASRGEKTEKGRQRAGGIKQGERITEKLSVKRAVVEAETRRKWRR